MVVPRNSRHCGDCGVCVRDYDHHCPWTSKCIGGNNLVRFYLFLIWTPLYLVYITIAFIVCMSENTVSIKQLNR
jgi:palmitoyltransferase ZDHHC9/14/18